MRYFHRAWTNLNYRNYRQCNERAHTPWVKFLSETPILIIMPRHGAFISLRTVGPAEALAAAVACSRAGLWRAITITTPSVLPQNYAGPTLLSMTSSSLSRVLSNLFWSHFICYSCSHQVYFLRGT